VLIVEDVESIYRLWVVTFNVAGVLYVGCFRLRLVWPT